MREWLRGLDRDARKEIGSDVMAVQWRWPLGLPLVDGLGEGLYEVRTRVGRDGYRVLFCVTQSTMVLLHGFRKKSRAAPRREFELARRRRREVEEEQ